MSSKWGVKGTIEVIAGLLGIPVAIITLYLFFAADSKDTSGDANSNKSTAEASIAEAPASPKKRNVSDGEQTDADASSLFANDIDRIHAEQEAANNANQQLEELLQELPTLIVAEVTEPPKLLGTTNDTGKIEVRIAVRPDREQYTETAKKLCSFLDDVAIEQSEWFAKFRAEQHGNTSYLWPGHIDDELWSWMPKAFDKTQSSFGSDGFVNTLRFRSDVIALGVGLNWNEPGRTLHGKYYVLNERLREALLESAKRRGTGRIELIDSKGETIAVEPFSIALRKHLNLDTFEGHLMMRFGRYQSADVYILDPTMTGAASQLFIVWPLFGVHGTNKINVQPELIITKEMALAISDIKRIADVRCQIRFD